jgi:hypothetical protein
LNVAISIEEAAPMSIDCTLPPRVLPPAFVNKLATALSAISAADFDKRFDVKKLVKDRVYPRIWNEPRTALLGQFRGSFERLRRFVTGAAERGDALVVDVS